MYVSIFVIKNIWKERKPFKQIFWFRYLHKLIYSSWFYFLPDENFKSFVLTKVRTEKKAKHGNKLILVIWGNVSSLKYNYSSNIWLKSYKKILLCLYCRNNSFTLETLAVKLLNISNQYRWKLWVQNNFEGNIFMPIFLKSAMT